MVQYCRYCNNMVCSDVNYCNVKKQTFTDKQICRTNKCKDFEFNEIDALGLIDTYKPRVKQKTTTGYEQIEL